MAKQVNENVYYDLERLMDFVFNGSGERTSDVEITDTQVKNETTGKLETESRIIREVKSNDSDKQTLRYDLLKMFIATLDNVEIDGEIAPLSLGQQVILNTLGAYGLIKEFGHINVGSK